MDEETKAAIFDLGEQIKDLSSKVEQLSQAGDDLETRFDDRFEGLSSEVGKLREALDQNAIADGQLAEIVNEKPAIKPGQKMDWS